MPAIKNGIIVGLTKSEFRRLWRNRFPEIIEAERKRYLKAYKEKWSKIYPEKIRGYQKRYKSNNLEKVRERGRIQKWNKRQKQKENKLNANRIGEVARITPEVQETDGK